MWRELRDRILGERPEDAYLLKNLVEDLCSSDHAFMERVIGTLRGMQMESLVQDDAKVIAVRQQLDWYDDQRRAACKELQKLEEKIKAARDRLTGLELKVDKELPKNKGKFIYFASKQEWIKIGISSDPHRRMSDLRKIRGIHPAGMVHGPVELLHYFPGTYRDEHDLHAMFAEYRDVGEWFHDVAPIRKYVTELACAA